LEDRCSGPDDHPPGLPFQTEYWKQEDVYSVVRFCISIPEEGVISFEDDFRVYVCHKCGGRFDQHNEVVTRQENPGLGAYETVWSCPCGYGDNPMDQHICDPCDNPHISTQRCRIDVTDGSFDCAAFEMGDCDGPSEPRPELDDAIAGNQGCEHDQCSVDCVGCDTEWQQRRQGQNRTFRKATAEEIQRGVGATEEDLKVVNTILDDLERDRIRHNQICPAGDNCYDPGECLAIDEAEAQGTLEQWEEEEPQATDHATFGNAEEEE
jgi:hypothetical protein